MADGQFRGRSIRFRSTRAGSSTTVAPARSSRPTSGPDSGTVTTTTAPAPVIAVTLSSTTPIGAVQFGPGMRDEHSDAGEPTRLGASRTRPRPWVREGDGAPGSGHGAARLISLNHFGSASRAYPVFARNSRAYSGTNTTGAPKKRKAMQSTP